MDPCRSHCPALRWVLLLLVPPAPQGLRLRSGLNLRCAPTPSFCQNCTASARCSFRVPPGRAFLRLSLWCNWSARRPAAVSVTGQGDRVLCLSASVPRGVSATVTYVCRKYSLGAACCCLAPVPVRGLWGGSLQPRSCRELCTWGRWLRLGQGVPGGAAWHGGPWATRLRGPDWAPPAPESFDSHPRSSGGLCGPRAGTGV